MQVYTCPNCRTRTNALVHCLPEDYNLDLTPEPTGTPSLEDYLSEHDEEGYAELDREPEE